MKFVFVLLITLLTQTIFTDLLLLSNAILSIHFEQRLIKISDNDNAKANDKANMEILALKRLHFTTSLQRKCQALIDNVW